jgi:NTE family protein
VLGGAWLTGGLKALADETGWDPASADHIVGTSAGALTGSLIAAGVPPWFMVAHSAGATFEGLTGPDGRLAAEADRGGGAVFRLHRAAFPLGPGSLRMALTTLANPLRHTPLQLLAGWLPAGVFSTNSIEDTVRRAVRGRWVPHPAFWAVACDYRTGKRVPFGRVDTPTVDVAEAVAASCAIPGFFRPVQIGGRPYVDGGVCSASSADLLAGHGLDLVICLNPLSSPHRVGGLHPLDRFGDLTRAANGRRLAHELRKLRRYGTKVVVIEPTSEDLATMGYNLMSHERRQLVIDTAVQTVADQLRQPGPRAKLEGLPQAEPHRLRRPPGPPSTWPRMSPLRRAA